MRATLHKTRLQVINGLIDKTVSSKALKKAYNIKAAFTDLTNDTDYKALKQELLTV